MSPVKMNSIPFKLAAGLTTGLAGAAGSAHAAIITYNNTFTVAQASATSATAASPRITLDAYNSFTLNQSSGYAGKTQPVKAPQQGTWSVSGITGLAFDRVANGTEVGAGSTFADTPGNPGNNFDDFFGMKLSETGSGPLYGWIEFSGTNSSGNQTTTINYAFDSSGANAIVGSYDSLSPVPEPASTAIMGALLAGSVAIWKRRQQKTAA